MAAAGAEGGGGSAAGVFSAAQPPRPLLRSSDVSSSGGGGDVSSGGGGGGGAATTTATTTTPATTTSGGSGGSVQVISSNIMDQLGQLRLAARTPEGRRLAGMRTFFSLNPHLLPSAIEAVACMPLPRQWADLLARLELHVNSGSSGRAVAVRGATRGRGALQHATNGGSDGGGLRFTALPPDGYVFGGDSIVSSFASADDSRMLQPVSSRSSRYSQSATSDCERSEGNIMGDERTGRD